MSKIFKSHPSWVCGLKHLCDVEKRPAGVTPFVGVWIETYRQKNMLKTDTSHTLRGCVD